MIKMSTLFVVEYHATGKPGIIHNIVREENAWVFSERDKVTATQKFDGTAVLIKNGEIYRRYDAKHGKQPPEGAIPCQEPDSISGHWPHWVKCSRDNKQDKYFFEAFTEDLIDGTYELCGTSINKNPEQIEGHRLLKHGSVVINNLDFSFEAIKEYLSNPENNIEGIVFHHEDGRMCKIRKTDFGVIR